MAKGPQAIKGKALGDRIDADQATKALAATKTTVYQFKTYTVPGGGWTDEDLSEITPDAPNAADNLFSQFKRAYSIFLRSDQTGSIKLGDNADAIPIRSIDGGLYEEGRIEFEKLLVTFPAGAVIDVYIS